MRDRVKPRLAALLVLVALAAAACANGSSTPTTSSGANTSGDNIYNGLSGQEMVYLASGTTGAFNRALTDSLFANFEKKTGMKVTIDSFCCGVSKLAGMVDAGNVTWTVTQFGLLNDWKEAEAQSLLVKLDKSIIPVDKLLPGNSDDYGFTVFPYAATVMWNTDAFPVSGKHPTTIEDVFDTTNFPGRRCLSKYPQGAGTLEAAALASGVAPDKLYPLDVDRALKELDKIKSNTLFWTDAAQGIQAILTGSCKIGISWNGPEYDAIQQNPGAKLAIAYGHAIWEAAALAIPKGTKNLQAAQALLRWILDDTDGQAKLLSETTYLVANLKNPPTIPDKIKPYALAGENLKVSIQEDAAWYGRNIDTVLKKFNAWLVSG
jgi:putative spermidine/putrescine transport system substrate-binding protein